MASATSSPWRPSPRVRPWALGGALALGHIPFLATRSLQDDAFITWRCAVQLADTGVYGFNPGERVSASTSHAYVALVALLRLVFRDGYIPATLGVNVGLTVAALFLVCQAVCPERRVRDACWALSALSPVALVVSSSGMETALLVFALAVAIEGLGRPSPPRAYAFVALGILPWIRLDAIFAAGVIALAHATRSRTVFLRAALAGLTGLATVLAFNVAYFGVLLNQSIVGKLSALRVSHHPLEMLSRVVAVYLGGAGTTPAFMPLDTKYLTFLGPLFAGASAVACFVVVRREPRRAPRRSTALAISVIALATPAVYAAVSVIYAWYFWPSLLLATVVLALFALDAASRRGDARFAQARSWLGALLGVSMAAQWVIAYSAGVKEHEYVGSVGAFVRSEGRPEETLFSEMAGSIPYISGLRTADEWGLVSPPVTRFEQERGERWEAAFLRSEQPTWIVLRAPLESRLPAGEASEDVDRAWVLARYDLLRRFQYTPRDYVAKGPLLCLARLGSAPDFFVYRLTTPRGRPPPR